MTVLSILGILILLIGAFLLVFGLQKTRTLKDKIVEGVTGRYTVCTLRALIIGGFLVLLGALLIFIGWRSSGM